MPDASKVQNVDLDLKFMGLALDQARLATQNGEVPVGAVIVGPESTLVSSAYNMRETKASPTAHAEILAIEEASKKLGRWRLHDCTLYVTLEPCSMCAGAIVLARFKRVVFGARDPKGGAVFSLYQILSDPRLNHEPLVREGVMASACSQILSEFFKARREKS